MIAADNGYGASVPECARWMQYSIRHTDEPPSPRWLERRRVAPEALTPPPARNFSRLGQSDRAAGRGPVDLLRHGMFCGEQATAFSLASRLRGRPLKGED